MSYRRAKFPKPTVYHRDPSPTSWQLWYADADFDNGFTLAVSYCFGIMRPPGDASRRFIEFSLYDSKGNTYSLRARFSPEECKASEDKCDVVMGQNFYRERDSKYHVRFSDSGLGCDLTYDPIMSGHQVNLVSIPGISETYNWYMTIPRAKVKGTVTIDGKTLEVQGEGYHDVSWDNSPLWLTGTENIFWGKIFLGDWTFIWQAGTLIAGRDNKSILESNKGFCQPLDLTTKDTPVERPQRISFKINDPGVIEGKIDFKVLRVLEFFDLLKGFKKPFQRWFAGAYAGRPAYIRYRLEHNVNLTVQGEKVTGKGISWCEHHKVP